MTPAAMARMPSTTSKSLINHNITVLLRAQPHARPVGNPAGPVRSAVGRRTGSRPAGSATHDDDPLLGGSLARSALRHTGSQRSGTADCVRTAEGRGPPGLQADP